MNEGRSRGQQRDPRGILKSVLYISISVVWSISLVQIPSDYSDSMRCSFSFGVVLLDPAESLFHGICFLVSFSQSFSMFLIIYTTVQRIFQTDFPGILMQLLYKLQQNNSTNQPTNTLPANCSDKRPATTTLQFKPPINICFYIKMNLIKILLNYLLLINYNTILL